MAAELRRDLDACGAGSTPPSTRSGPSGSAGDLVKRTWSEPYWSKKRASALAHERVTLYGVPLVADRLVDLGTHAARRRARAVHPARPGAGRVAHPAPLLRDQPPTARGGRASSSTGRAGTTSWSTSSTLVRLLRRPHPGRGRLRGPLRHAGGSRSAAAAPTCSPSTRRCWCTRARSVDEGDFPDAWHEGPLTLPLRYHFEPGHEADGVTIDVPLATLNTVGAEPFTWNVPGPARTSW